MMPRFLVSLAVFADLPDTLFYAAAVGQHPHECLQRCRRDGLICLEVDVYTLYDMCTGRRDQE